jgi:hypothetical protein
MSFFIYPDRFDATHVHFCPATRNQRDDHAESKFSRIVYSTPHISLNSMGFILHLTPSKPAQPIYSAKWVVSYDPDHPTNAGIISQLRGIECAIIDKYVRTSESPRHRSHALAQQLSLGCIKAYAHTSACELDDDMDAEACDGIGANNDNSGNNSGNNGGDGDSASQLILTIFGVWETPATAECGIIYRFTKW